jgi:DNA-3-methyladenine glycosylase II
MGTGELTPERLEEIRRNRTFDQQDARCPARGELSSTNFVLHPRGPYSFEASVQFLTGFSPTQGSAAEVDGHLHLAFVPDGQEEAAGVCLRADGGGVRGEIFGETDGDVVERQVARILSLDVDGTAYSEAGRRDPVIGRLQERYPGLRPVLFYSPYEAAVWAILSQRVQGRQAALIKQRMTEQLGTVVDIHGDRLWAFPAPSRLIELNDFRGLFGRKAEYLQEIGHAAYDGRLDATRLRSLPPEEGLAAIRKLPGVGEFSSHLILLRGVGIPDGPVPREPRLLRALSLAYGIGGEPIDADVQRISEKWRPYRTWVTFLLRRMLTDLQS